MFVISATDIIKAHAWDVNLGTLKKKIKSIAHGPSLNFKYIVEHLTSPFKETAFQMG